MVPMGGASGDSDPGVSGILFFGIHISFTTQAPAKLAQIGPAPSTSGPNTFA